MTSRFYNQNAIHLQTRSIFSLRNFGQMSEFRRNFSVSMEFISVIFITAKAILAYDFKILLNFFGHFDRIG